MAASSFYSHPIFQPGLVPVGERRAVAHRLASNGPGELVLRRHGPLRLAETPAGERARARKLLGQLRRRRAGWLGHLRSFVAVNAGLAAINLLSSIGAGSIYPWFLYVTASWGVGFVIHGMTYRGWLSDHRRELTRADEVLTATPVDALPAPSQAAAQDDEQDGLASAPTLPGGEVDDGGWIARVVACREALRATRDALESASLSPEVRAELAADLSTADQTIARVNDAALTVRRAIAEVAPDGVEALDAELDALEAKIAGTDDERLAALIGANRHMLAARREKLSALLAGEQRLRTTIDGVRIAAENIRLDAARLGADQLPETLTTLGDSLRQLDDEVEIARQVEDELGRL